MFWKRSAFSFETQDFASVIVSTVRSAGRLKLALDQIMKVDRSLRR